MLAQHMRHNSPRQHCRYYRWELMLEAQILKGKSGKIKICFHIITISTIMLAYISVQSNTFIGNVFLLNKEHVEELQ